MCMTDKCYAALHCESYERDASLTAGAVMAPTPRAPCGSELRS